MKRSAIRFLKKQGKIKLVEPSLNVCSSYFQKADNSLSSGKILFQKKLYEDSISMFYYCMYNSLLALLFRVGIKSENHSFSIFLLKRLFCQEDLFEIISFAKRARIETQYYVNQENSVEELAKQLFLDSEEFLVRIKLFFNSVSSFNVKEMRDIFLEVIK
jgi:uncharacterized protein (UPF0332 family)